VDLEENVSTRASTAEFDYIIVGAGSAGCVLSKRLAADRKHSILLLEAGPSDRNLYIHVPAGYVKNLLNKKLTWGFVSAPVPGAGNRCISLPQGKTLGGSSCLNGMIYNRGQRGDYDSWAQQGNAGWSYDDVLPYFRRSEHRTAGDANYRGQGGPLTVTDPVVDHPLCAKFVEAAKALGIPEVEDYNSSVQDGVGRFQFTIDLSGPRAWRRSTARAFLHPAVKTGHISVRTEAYVSRILFEGKKAVGVQYTEGANGSPKEVYARREIIVSAGALNTPRLLQISGIGDPEHLTTIGVPVVAPLKGVGANLADHYGVRVAAKVKSIRTINERGRGVPLLWEIAKWVVGAPSILGIGPSLMRMFTRTDPQLEHPNLQMWFTPASYTEGIPGFLDYYPGMTCGGWKQRPESRGWVRAVSTDIHVQPEIQPNYLSTESDRRDTVVLLNTARKILSSQSFSQYFVEESFPGRDVRNDDEILTFARERGGTSYHHVGTAKMGPSHDPYAVVDDRLRVHGLHGLRVVDASIMPSITSSNTNAPTIMIAEKAADMILADARQ
jgi:choline dehydrogenase